MWYCNFLVPSIILFSKNSVNQDSGTGKEMAFMTFSEHLKIGFFLTLYFNSFDHLKQNLDVTKFQKKTQDVKYLISNNNIIEAMTENYR